MTKIDAHIHWNGDHPSWLSYMEEVDLRCINVSVVSTPGEWRLRERYVRTLAGDDPTRFAWITTFDLPKPGERDYAERVIAGLERDLTDGAAACKVWKNFGMELKTDAGDWMMVDDPLLEPIFAFLARRGTPLLAHIGEPLACWEPLDPDNPHFGYYSRNPQWHLYGKPGYPSHAEIIAARDRLLARHPDLRVIGAHLGSLEYNVAEIADRLNRYPNFAIDTSARIKDLALQDSNVVSQFLDRYSSRVMWGTDQVCRESMAAMTEADRREWLEKARRTYQLEWDYYESSGPVVIGGRTVRGLALSPEVLDRIYRRNALDWYGLTATWGEG